MSILVIGNDGRQKSLADILSDEGYESFPFSGDFCDFERANTLILPLPLTRDHICVNSVPNLKLSDVVKNAIGKKVFFGNGTEEFMQNIGSIAKLVFDYNRSERFQYENARITAEATISAVIEKTDFSLFGTYCVIIGFGRIGKILSRYFSALGARVCICARKETDLACASALGYDAVSIRNGFPNEFSKRPDVVLNTAPARIITAENSKCIAKSVIFDLAGNGSMSDCCKEVIPALGLPAKYSPRSSALALFNSIKEEL